MPRRDAIPMVTGASTLNLEAILVRETPRSGYRSFGREPHGKVTGQSPIEPIYDMGVTYCGD